MMTVDFSGIREESDIDYITRNFHSGPHRDGRGFLAWCHGFADHSDVGEQDRLQVKLANFKLTGNDFSLVQIEKHCVDLFSVWKKVAGNDVTAPSSYNARLLSSIPATVGGQLGSLRSWLADKITDQAPFLSDPDKTIDKLVAHARTLGFRETGISGAPAGEMIIFIKHKGSCKLCDGYLCNGKDKDGCFGFNKAKPIPSTCTPGQRDYIEVQRKYVELVNPATLKSVPQGTMRAVIAKATGQSGAVNAAVISDVNAFNAWLANNQLGSHVVSVISTGELSPMVEEGGTDADALFPAAETTPVVAVGALKISDGISDRVAFDAWLEANALCPSAEVEGAPMAALPEVASAVGAEIPDPEEGGANALASQAMVVMPVCVASPLRMARGAVGSLRSPDSVPSAPRPVVAMSADQLVAPEPDPRPALAARFLAAANLIRGRLMNLDKDTRFTLFVSAFLLYHSRGSAERFLAGCASSLRAALLRHMRRVLRGVTAAGAYLAVVASTASLSLPSA